MSRSFLHILRVIALLVLATQSGCLAVRYDVERLTDPQRVNIDEQTAEHFERRAQLTERIASLAPTVDPAEAALLADVAMTYAMQLAQRYRLTQPAITHNMLVNMGARPRGLCIHWTEDLLTRLNELPLTTLDLYWGVAYPTRPLRLEHSSPVVTARDMAFDSGILLDGWRDSGRLFFAGVAEDKRYHWQRLHNAITDPPPETLSTP